MGVGDGCDWPTGALGYTGPIGVTGTLILNLYPQWTGYAVMTESDLSGLIGMTGIVNGVYALTITDSNLWNYTGSGWVYVNPGATTFYFHDITPSLVTVDVYQCLTGTTAFLLYGRIGDFFIDETLSYMYIYEVGGWVYYMKFNGPTGDKADWGSGR